MENMEGKMSFDEYGFLGNYENEVIKDNYEKHIYIFKICEETNAYAQNAKCDFKINQFDRQGLLAISLFSKILNTFQAVVILYKYGLSSQAKMLTRVVLESLFVMKSIIKDEKNIDKLIKSINKNRERMLKNINNNAHGVYTDFLGEDLKCEFEDLKEKNKKDDAEFVQAKKWATESESYYEYFLAYELLSKDIHIDIINLEQYIDFDDDGNVQEFNIQPNTNDIKEVLLHTACNAMIQAISCMSKHCNLDNETIIENFYNKLI